MGLRDWFGRSKAKNSSPDAPSAPSRQAWQAADMNEVLRAPEHILTDTEDVSAGSRGYSLHALERAGLLRIERIARVSPMDIGAWRFTPTGRARALEANRAARAVDDPSPDAQGDQA